MTRPRVRRLRTTQRELSERDRAELVLQTQLELAASMQQRLLPPVPAEADGFEWAGAPYVTGIAARVDTHARTLTAVNAGHPAGRLLRNPARAAIAATARQPFGSTAALCDAIMQRAMHGAGPAGVADWSDDRTVVAFTVGAPPPAPAAASG